MVSPYLERKLRSLEEALRDIEVAKQERARHVAQNATDPTSATSEPTQEKPD